MTILNGKQPIQTRTINKTADLKAWLAWALLGLAMGGCDGLRQNDVRQSFHYGTGNSARDMITMQVFAPALVPPPEVENGSMSHAHFVLASGILPPGLALEPHSGKIVGVPTKPGQFLATIGLKTDEHAAMLTVPVTLTIEDQTLSYPGVAATRLLLEAGTPLSGLQPRHEALLAPGVKPHFAAADPASLPQGVTIDPEDGHIGGIPMQAGVFDIKVGMTLQYLNATRTYVATIPCWIKLPGVSMSSGGVRG